MGIVAYGYDPGHCDVLWQDAVHAFDNIVGHRDGGVEVGYHESGIDSCIGAAGSDDFGGLSAEDGDGAVEFGLDAVAVGLDLPPVVSGSVVGEIDEIAHGDYLTVRWKQAWRRSYLT